MEFSVSSPENQRDILEVRYDCACGCKPVARYRRGTQEPGHEHCCCGNVHFAGYQAGDQLRRYLSARQARGEDAGLVYTIHNAQVRAPWGEQVAVAYALPDLPKPH